MPSKVTPPLLPGLQSVKSEQMDSRTFEMVSAGLHWSCAVSTQSRQSTTHGHEQMGWARWALDSCVHARTPLTALTTNLENVQANGTVAGNVAVVNPCLERDLWRAKWVVLWKYNV